MEKSEKRYDGKLNPEIVVDRDIYRKSPMLEALEALKKEEKEVRESLRA